MVNRFTPAGENAVKQAQLEAEELGHCHVGTEHLLLSLAHIRGSVAYELLCANGIEYSAVKTAVIRLCGGISSTRQSPEQTPRLRAILSAASECKGGAFGRVGTEVMLRELLKESSSSAVKVIECLGIDPTELLSAVTSSARVGEGVLSVCENKRVKKFSPTLSKYAVPLSSGRDDPVIGRERETDSLIRVLCRRTKNNPCLVGEPGVGKTAIVEGLSRRIAEGSVPDALRGKSIISLDVPSMLAGAKYRGDFEERLKNVLVEVAADPDVILFIDELHTVMGAGASEGAIDASNILKPALARGKMTLIGATTTDEYRRFIERDSAFERRLQPITVNEPTEEEARAVLLGLRDRYEAHHGIKITDGAINDAIGLSLCYLPDRRLPDKALDLLDEAAADKRIALEGSRRREGEVSAIIRGIGLSGENGLDGVRDSLLLSLDKSHDGLLSASDVKTTLSRTLGRSLDAPSGAELSVGLKGRIFGQDKAVERLCLHVCAARLYKKRSRPALSVLIYGESGSGKTLMASALSEELYGEAPLRFDLSEYADKGSASSLIGSPPGYVGYGDEGALIKRLRSRPISVLLLENVNLAHPDVVAIVKELLECGKITSPSGRSADAKNTTVVLTVRTKGDSRPLGFGDSGGSNVNSILPDGIAELVDTKIMTEPLNETSRSAIAEGILSEMTDAFSSVGVAVSFGKDVVSLCAKASGHGGGGHGISAFIRENVESLALPLMTDAKGGTKYRFFTENGKISLKEVTPKVFGAYTVAKEDKKVMP